MELTQSLQFVVSVHQIPPQQEQHQTGQELETQMQVLQQVVQMLSGQEPVHQMELLEPAHQTNHPVLEPEPQIIQY